MLLRFEKHIAACNLRSAKLETMARGAPDKNAAAEYLRLAESWRHLAKNYEFVETLECFLQRAHQGEWPPKGQDLPRPPVGLDLFFEESDNFFEESDNLRIAARSKSDSEGSKTWRNVLLRLTKLKWGSPHK